MNLAWEQHFSLKKLDPAGRYQVCLRDEDFRETRMILEGHMLLTGVQIRIGRPRASVVLTYFRESITPLQAAGHGN